MDYKVLITDAAIYDLAQIIRFVAQDDSISAARVGEKLIGRVSRLATLAERFPLHDKRRAIRKMTVAPYLIFYTIERNAAAVYVLHIWHGARRPPHFPG